MARRSVGRLPGVGGRRGARARPRRGARPPWSPPWRGTSQAEDGAHLRRRCRRVLARISPDLLHQRAARARAESGLRRWADEPGVDRWEGTFPSEEAARAWAAIDALARQYVSDGVCSTHRTGPRQGADRPGRRQRHHRHDHHRHRPGHRRPRTTPGHRPDRPPPRPRPTPRSRPRPHPAEPGVRARAVSTRDRRGRPGAGHRPRRRGTGPGLPPVAHRQPRDGVRGAGRALSPGHRRPARPRHRTGEPLRPAAHGPTPRPPTRQHRAATDRHAVGRDGDAQHAAGTTGPTGRPGSAVSRLPTGTGRCGAAAAGFGADSYRPSTRMAKRIRARDRRCRFPGCSIAAVFCDLDHVRPWPHGRTRDDNLLCLCRRHHRIKQRPGWQVTLTADAVATWTDPTGRTRTTHPVDALRTTILTGTGCATGTTGADCGTGTAGAGCGTGPTGTGIGTATATAATATSSTSRARTVIPDGPHSELEFLLEHHGAAPPGQQPTRTPVTGVARRPRPPPPHRPPPAGRHPRDRPPRVARQAGTTSAEAPRHRPAAVLIAAQSTLWGGVESGRRLRATPTRTCSGEVGPSPALSRSRGSRRQVAASRSTRQVRAAPQTVEECGTEPE